jgi:hypothetical protein
MKHIFFLSILLIIFFISLINCNRNPDILYYQEPDTSSHPPQPYMIMVSKYYDSLFATSPSGGFEKVQDFDIYEDVLYLWVFYSLGLYEYHLNDQTLIPRGVSPAGDCIAADSGRVFWAAFGEPLVFLYSLEDFQSMVFINNQDYSVSGLQVYEHNLYVLYEKKNGIPEENLLNIYSMDGDLIESKSYQRQTYYLTINHGIVYSTVYDRDQDTTVVTRFDLSNGTFLADVECPSQSCDGIRSYGDFFFFTDFYNEYIGYVQLEEIEARGK